MTSPKARVLIVDPSRVVRASCAARCRERGFDVEEAEDVCSALAALLRGKPTVVLTSLELPGLPGSAFVAALRASPEHRAIPIAVLTSTDPASIRFDHDRPERIIGKSSGLRAALDAFFDEIGLPTHVASAPSGALCGRILLAEDGLTNQKILGKILHVGGADVTIVRNGREALDLALARPFDLVLMDVEMPEMDGREATKALRARGVTIPIYALTGHEEEAFAAEARALGFDGVLHKPVDRQRLIDTCASALRARAA